MPKHVLFFFCHQYNANFRPLIMHRFWLLLKSMTWIGVRMRKPMKNFRISAQGVLQVPKTTKIGTFEGVCDRDRLTAQMAQFRAIEITSGTSLHPKDVPFEHEFWWGTYGLGAISPRKKTNFGDRWRRLRCVRRYITIQRHLQEDSTLSSSLYCSESPDTLQHI